MGRVVVVLQGLRAQSIVLGEQVPGQGFQGVAGRDVHVPRLDVAAAGRLRGDAQEMFHEGSGYRVGQEGPCAAPEEDRFIHCGGGEVLCGVRGHNAAPS